MCKSFSAPNQALLIMAGNLRYLKELRISETSLSNAGCTALAALGPSLTFLEIGSAELTHVDGLRWVACSLVEATGHAAQSGVQAGHRGTPSRRLCIPGKLRCALFRHLTRLERLECNLCETLTEASLLGVLAHLTALRQLLVHYCFCISFRNLLDVAYNMLNLESLDYDDNGWQRTKVTFDRKQRLAQKRKFSG